MCSWSYPSESALPLELPSPLALGVGRGVTVGVGVGFRVGLGVRTGVTLGVGVAVGLAVAVAVGLAVAVGVGAGVGAGGGTGVGAPPPPPPPPGVGEAAGVGRGVASVGGQRFGQNGSSSADKVSAGSPTPLSVARTVSSEGFPARYGFGSRSKSGLTRARISQSAVVKPSSQTLKLTVLSFGLPET